jgi:excisionase family DNA binding protein
MLSLIDRGHVLPLTDKRVKPDSDSGRSFPGEGHDMRNDQQPGDGARGGLQMLSDQPPNAAHSTIPFAQRLACTIAEACEATGLGRTKLYELIGEGHLDTTTIGRRRLVLVRSLRALLVANEA